MAEDAQVWGNVQVIITLTHAKYCWVYQSFDQLHGLYAGSDDMIRIGTAALRHTHRARNLHGSPAFRGAAPA